MLLKDNEKRALKRYIKGKLLGGKRRYIVLASIIMAVPVVTLLVNLIIYLAGAINSGSSGGALVTGLGISAIYMLVSSISAASKKESRLNFTFPMTRKIHTIGVIAMAALNTLLFLMFSSISFLIELGASWLCSLLPGYEIINHVTVESFFVGFLVSFIYIMFLSSFTYCLFTFLNRYKLSALLAVALPLGIMFVFGWGREILYKILSFYVLETSASIFLIKAIVTSIILFAVSYLPVRRMEVRT